MEELIAKDAFIEHAEYSANHYGTSKQAVRHVMDNGKVMIAHGVGRVLFISVVESHLPCCLVYISCTCIHIHTLY